MSNIIDLSKLPISDGKQVINIIGLNDNGNVIRAENDTYSKSEIDEKVANVKVDLTGYATERWVKQQGYVTDGDVNDYVENEIGQVEERFNDYYTKPEVDDLINNIDIPEGTGGATKYMIDLRDDDGYSMYRLDANMFLQEDKICYVRYVKYNTENGTEYFESILNGGRYENPSEFIPYVWSIIDDKLFTWDFSDGSTYAIPTITPIGGGSGEGGDSGAYILEGIEPILEAEFWYHPETGEIRSSRPHHPDVQGGRLSRHQGFLAPH